MQDRIKYTIYERVLSPCREFAGPQQEKFLDEMSKEKGVHLKKHKFGAYEYLLYLEQELPHRQGNRFPVNERDQTSMGQIEVLAYVVLLMAFEARDQEKLVYDP